MNLITVLGRVEAVLSSCGFLLLIGALVADFGCRAFVGESLAGAPQVALTGLIIMALFGVGVAAHAGDHQPLRLRAVYFLRWRETVVGIRHFVTSVFFLGLFSLAVYTCVESRVLGDVTALSGWPLWVLQGLMVISFALNSLRYLLYAFDARLRGGQRSEPWLRRQDYI